MYFHVECSFSIFTDFRKDYIFNSSIYIYTFLQKCCNTLRENEFCESNLLFRNNFLLNLKDYIKKEGIFRENLNCIYYLKQKHFAKNAVDKLQRNWKLLFLILRIFFFSKENNIELSKKSWRNNKHYYWSLLYFIYRWIMLFF